MLRRPVFERSLPALQNGLKRTGTQTEISHQGRSFSDRGNKFIIGEECKNQFEELPSQNSDEHGLMEKWNKLESFTFCLTLKKR
jgi:hypothetical protein